LRAGRELERLISDEGHELGRRQRLFKRCEHRLSEHIEIGEVRQPARVVEELAHCDVAPRVRQLGKALGDRVVERHHSFVDQGQHRRPAEGFGHAGDAHVVLERGRLVCAQFGHTSGVDRAIRATLRHDDRARRTTRHRHQLLDGLVQFLLGIQLVCPWPSCRCRPPISAPSLRGLPARHGTNDETTWWPSSPLEAAAAWQPPIPPP